MSSIGFSLNKTKGAVPLYIRFSDTSDFSDITSATNYTRIWSVTNLRTSAVEFFDSTSATIDYCISADSLFGDVYTVSLSAVI